MLSGSREIKESFNSANGLTMTLLPHIVFTLLIIIAATTSTAQTTGKVLLKGTFQQSAKGSGIESALITVAGIKTLHTVTDSSGNFTLELAPGKSVVSLSHIGYKTQTIILNLTKDTSILLAGETNAKSLQEVVITATDNRSKVFTTQTGVETVDRKTALTLPAILGEVDIIKVFQLKPGVKNSGEGTSGISVRGGGTDQNLFLFDGSPVYNPNHLFGFFSTFNIDAIKDVQLYKAGFPAEFSGRLSSIVNVNSLRGTDSAFSIGGGIGLIASRLNVQGNLLKKKKGSKKLTYNIAGRRTYADVFTGLINNANKSDTAFNPIPTYYFYDANARIDYQLSDKESFFGSLYHGLDYFKFDSDIFGSTFSWGNTAASLHWKKQLKNSLHSELSLHLSDYNYSLQSIFDRFDFRLGSGVKEYSLSHKFLYHGINRHQLSLGYQAGYNEFSISKFNINSTDDTETLASGENISGTEAGAFISDDWDATKTLRINAGARFTMFYNKKIYIGLEPRISIRQLINDKLSIKASYSRMQQYKHLVVSSGASLPTDIWYPSTQKIKPEISDQVSLGYTWNIADKFLITNEAYYKWMRQLVDYKPGANLLVNSSLENEFVFGKGKSYGTEFSFEKTAGKLRGWIGYTLAWSIRQFDAINNGKEFYPRYDRRHEASVVASYPISKRLTFSGSWTYYTGNAVSLPTGRTIGVDAPGTLDANTFFTLSPIYPERSNYRMPDYHRLDIGIIWKLKTKKGRSADITFSAYNAYSRLNAYYISFQPKDNGNTIMGTPAGYTPKAVTLFPIIPSITYNFKF